MSSLLKYLNEVEPQVAQWAPWKLASIRAAFQIPVIDTATCNNNKPFMTKDIKAIKQMYESGLSYKEIAQGLKRSVSSVTAATHRLIRCNEIKTLRGVSIIHLGGLEAAKKALSRAKTKGHKFVKYTNAKGKTSHVTVANLEKQIARYTAVNP